MLVDASAGETNNHIWGVHGQVLPKYTNLIAHTLRICKYSNKKKAKTFSLIQDEQHNQDQSYS